MLAVILFVITGLLSATYDIKSLIPKISLGFLEEPLMPSLEGQSVAYIALVAGILLLITAIGSISNWMGELLSIVVSFASGLIFSYGLVISGMTLRSKVHGFLDISGFSTGTWDASLLIVLMVGVGINLFTFNFAINIM